MDVIKLYKSECDVHHVVCFFCPGCKMEHPVRVKGDDVWTFNGDYVKPTFTPSVLINMHKPAQRCHSFISNGSIQFLDDCYHELRGTTVDLPPYPR